VPVCGTPSAPALGLCVPLQLAALVGTRARRYFQCCRQQQSRGPAYATGARKAAKLPSLTYALSRRPSLLLLCCCGRRPQRLSSARYASAPACLSASLLRYARAAAPRPPRRPPLHRSSTIRCSSPNRASTDGSSKHRRHRCRNECLATAECRGSRYATQAVAWHGGHLRHPAERPALERVGQPRRPVGLRTKRAAGDARAARQHLRAAGCHQLLLAARYYEGRARCGLGTATASLSSLSAHASPPLAALSLCSHDWRARGQLENNVHYQVVPRIYELFTLFGMERSSVERYRSACTSSERYEYDFVLLLPLIAMIVPHCCCCQHNQRRPAMVSLSELLSLSLSLLALVMYIVAAFLGGELRRGGNERWP